MCCAVFTSLLSPLCTEWGATCGLNDAINIDNELSMFPQTGIYLAISSPLCLWDSSHTSWLSECCKENNPHLCSNLVCLWTQRQWGCFMVSHLEGTPQSPSPWLRRQSWEVRWMQVLMGEGAHGNRLKSAFFVTEKGGLKPPSLSGVNVQTVNIWAAIVPSPAALRVISKVAAPIEIKTLELNF